MYEVMQIRAASWAAMIKQRNHSGLTIKEWCADDGIQKSVYYFRLNRMRKMALDVSETTRPFSQRGSCFRTIRSDTSRCCSRLKGSNPDPMR